MKNVSEGHKMKITYCGLGGEGSGMMGTCEPRIAFLHRAQWSDDSFTSEDFGAAWGDGQGGIMK